MTPLLPIIQFAYRWNLIDFCLSDESLSDKYWMVISAYQQYIFAYQAFCPSSFISIMGHRQKKIYPALICWYQQTGPAQFGQNHPPSSFSPHQAITATNQSWVDFFSADAPYPTLAQPHNSYNQSAKLSSKLFWTFGLIQPPILIFSLPSFSFSWNFRHVFHLEMKLG